jgi:acetaldehyde dehydrogenase (acetylating)
MQRTATASPNFYGISDIALEAAVADSMEKMVAVTTKYMTDYHFKQKLQLSAAELNKHFARPFWG